MEDPQQAITPSAANWVELVDRVLEVGTRGFAISPQARTILERRFGLCSGRVETLEAIGHDLSITRERVRQVQAKALGRIRRTGSGITGLSYFTREINQILGNLTGIAIKSEILSCLQTTREATTGYDASMAVAFLLMVCGYEIQMPKRSQDNWQVFDSPTTRVQVDKATKQALAIVKQLGPVPADRLRVLISGELNLPESIVSRMIATSGRVLVDPSGIAFETELSQWHKVAYSLRRLGRPAHFTEIATAVRTDFGHQAGISEHAVHAILGNHEPQIFRRVALGTFGLADWGLPVAKDTVDLVCQIFESEMSWMSFQQVQVQLRNKGWRYKPSSVRAALDLEHGRPDRRTRRIGQPGSYRYGLAWWHRDDV